MIDKIIVGDQLSFIVADIQKGESRTYRSQVRSVVSKSSQIIQIEIPSREEAPLDLEQYEGQGRRIKYIAVFYSHNKLISYRCSVIKELSGGRADYHLIRLSGEVQIDQRRAHLRFKKRINTVFSTQEISDRGVIQDISRGGIKFETGVPVEVGSRLAFAIELGGSVIHPEGTVLECLPPEAELPQYRVQFTQITPEEQEAISYFIRISMDQSDAKDGALF